VLLLIPHWTFSYLSKKACSRKNPHHCKYRTHARTHTHVCIYIYIHI